MVKADGIAHGISPKQKMRIKPMSNAIDDTARKDELMGDLAKTVTSLIRYHQAILDEINAKTYTSEKAYEDHQNLMFNEGNDMMYVLEELSKIQ